MSPVDGFTPNARHAIDLHDDDTPTHAAGSNRMFRGALVPAGIVVLAGVLRLINLTTSYDLFIDEPFYVALGQSVAQGHMPTAAGALFFLHPPGYSALEALWITALGGVRGTVIEQVYALRYLNATFAGVTALLIYLLGRRTLRPIVGVLAAVIFAISPWFIRQNSFVLLETSALTFVLAGYLGLVCIPSRRRARTLVLIVVGLAFGYSILIKEFAVFVTVVPMVLLRLRILRHREAVPERSLLSLRETIVVVAAAAVPYLVWVLIVLLDGDISTFWSQTLSGFRRAAGVHQVSGFNQPGTPSFVDTLVANVPQFWTTYLLMLLGSVAAIRLLVLRDTKGWLLGAFGVGSLPLLGYSVLFGANEEQFYYYLLIPSSLCVAVSLVSIWPRTVKPVKYSVVVLAVLWATSDLLNWAVVHTTPSNATEQVDDWLRNHVPAGTKVGVTDSVQREVLLRYDMVNDDRLAALTAAGDVDYLVVSPKKVKQGYAFISSADLAVQLGGRLPVYRAQVRGDEYVDVYDLG